MPDVLLRIILFFSLLFIGLFWGITTPKAFGQFALSLTKPSNWPILIFQVIPFLQLSGIFGWNWPTGKISGFFMFAGLAILYLGIFLACWAKLTMQNNWGRPGQHDIKSQASLVITGPYRFTRNPIYIGLFLVFAGFELALQSYFIVFAVPLAILINLMVYREEKLLIKYFGKSYRDYQNSVPRYVYKKYNMLRTT